MRARARARACVRACVRVCVCVCVCVCTRARGKCNWHRGLNFGCAYPTGSHQRKLSFTIIMSIYFRYNYVIFVYAVERQISMSFIDKMILHSVFGTFATDSYE